MRERKDRRVQGGDDPGRRRKRAERAEGALGTKVARVARVEETRAPAVAEARAAAGEEAEVAHRTVESRRCQSLVERIQAWALAPVNRAWLEQATRIFFQSPGGYDDSEMEWVHFHRPASSPRAYRPRRPGRAGKAVEFPRTRPGGPPGRSA